MSFHTLCKRSCSFTLKEKLIKPLRVFPGCEERGECAVPEELRGQLIRHNPGLVVQEETLTGELCKQMFGILGVFYSSL